MRGLVHMIDPFPAGHPWILLLVPTRNHNLLYSCFPCSRQYRFKVGCVLLASIIFSLEHSIQHVGPYIDHLARIRHLLSVVRASIAPCREQAYES